MPFLKNKDCTKPANEAAKDAKNPTPIEKYSTFMKGKVGGGKNYEPPKKEYSSFRKSIFFKGK